MPGTRSASHRPTSPHRAPLHPLAAAGLVACALALASGPARAIGLPPGFADDPLPFTFDTPTKLAFLPDGRMLVAEKGGIVYVVSGGVRHSAWVAEEEILNADDHGLLSIAVDPNFVSNRYIYFLYSCDPDSNGIELDNFDDTFGRLTRYQWSATDSNAVDLSTRTVLIGTSWNDGWPGGSGTHHADDLVWGSDGTLLVSGGDGAHFDTVDVGGRDPGLFLPGRVDSVEDIGAFRAQRLASLAGKVLRIDPATGLGLPSNPFYDGNPASVRSRVWTYGHRNPFRLTRRPETGSTDPADGQPGTLYIGEVGQNLWEEINVAREGGENFGWPCRDGPDPFSEYIAATPSSCGCETIGTPSNPSLPTDGVLSLHHVEPSLSIPPGMRANVIAGGVFYEGTGYPSAYRGLYFFGDYGQGWIRTLRVDSLDQRVEVLPFASSAMGPVTFAVDPVNGDVWYASIWTGAIHRIRFTAPLAVEPALMASSATLSAPSPHPAREIVRMALTLPAATDVEFEIYDLTGRRVWSLGAVTSLAGTTQLAWPVTDDSDGRAGPGIYFARVRAGGQEWTRRISVVR